MSQKFITPIPTSWVGPIPIDIHGKFEEVKVPLATYETPLWPSTARGARVARMAGAIKTTVLGQCMTRSVYFNGPDARRLSEIKDEAYAKLTTLQSLTEKTSRFCKLLDWHDEIIGNLWFIRFRFKTGDASGHNMATKAANELQHYLLEQYPDLSYGSISGNLCTDKKSSAINGILGRGHHTIAEIVIPRALCQKQLRATPEAISELNIKKNFIGSNLAGSLRSANAHFANILLAFYLATGQDAANIIEGSQGITYCETTATKDLYFSVSLPNLIVGTVGNGKHHEGILAALKQMGCAEENVSPGQNTHRLACLIAATTLCGELSLLAAQTNPGELIRSHLAIERRA